MSALDTGRLSALDEARDVLAALDADRAIAVATRLDDTDAGARLFVDAAGARGTLGDEALDRDAAAAARAALDAGGYEAGTITLGTARVLVDVHRPTPALFVVGAGHISVPLARIAAIAGFRVTVLDDREDFADAARFERDARVLRMDPTRPFAEARPGRDAYVVLVTRAHRYDYECLRDLLAHEPLPRYVGMIGSRRRVRAAFHALLEAGVPRESIARVRAPLGLDIGAQTPEEIAVSVVAEMVAVRRGVAERDDAGAPLAAREAVLDRFFPRSP
ncbi:MAG TPA: XdhC family protein [Longimicrobiales bacterium]